VEDAGLSDRQMQQCRQQGAFDVVWWLRAEKPATLVGDFTDLAGALNLPERTQTDPAVVVAAVHRWLANHGRWLLVFDNVTQPEDVTSLLPPAGGGQVLVTSRWAAWGKWAKPLQLEALQREESVSFLLTRTGTNDRRAAAALGEELGGLPLALEEAAAYVEATGISLDDCLRLARISTQPVRRKVRDCQISRRRGGRGGPGGCGPAGCCASRRRADPAASGWRR
jgi:hypothetical protein